MPLHAKAASTTVPFLMQLSMRVLKVSFLNSQEVMAVNKSVNRLLHKQSLYADLTRASSYAKDDASKVTSFCNPRSRVEALQSARLDWELVTTTRLAWARQLFVRTSFRKVHR